MRWKDENEWWEANNWEGGGQSLFQGTIPTSVFYTWWKPWQTSVTLVSNPAKIHTQYLLNTILEYYSYTICFVLLLEQFVDKNELQNLKFSSFPPPTKDFHENVY